MKVIMLDFDGVLNSHAYFKARGELGDVSEFEREALDPEAVARLNRIVEATGAVVVVSSSWRYGRSLEQLRELLQSRGFVGTVIDKLPDWSKLSDGNVYAEQERGDEIRTWLDAHPDVTSFVVLDDDSDMTAVRDRHIKTRMNEGGLLDEHVDKAIEMLCSAWGPTS